VRVGRIVGMNGHGMARGAEFAFRGDFKIGHVAGHRGSDRQWSETDEKPHLDRSIEHWAANEKNRENDRRKKR